MTETNQSIASGASGTSSDTVNAGGGRSNAITLEAGAIKIGKITSVSTDNESFEVEFSGNPNGYVSGVLWAADAIFSPFLGYKTDFTPPPGTVVAVLGGEPSYIIGILPHGDFVDNTAPSKTMLGKDTEFSARGTSQEDRENSSFTRQTDMFPGEFEISNMIGCFMRFLTTMVSVGAGDRAKVEAFILDDLVRIVSGTFKHFSAFGDMEIYNDGRLNVKFDGTSYAHEAYNKESLDEPLVDVEDYKVDSGEVLELGRRRFSSYLGWLGDFVHLIVTDPPEVLGVSMEDQYRSGKARVHISTDGSILAQSTAEIALERVIRIPVPKQKKRYDDPNGVLPDDFKDLDKKFLKHWDIRNLHHTGYQLREYARWLSGLHGYARFHQMEDKAGEWEVPSEGAADPPEWKNKETDREGSGAADYIDAYATVRIMRDGSILAMNTKGCAISLIQDTVQVSSTGSMEFFAAQDMSFSAKNIWMSAQHSIDISAIKGGLVLKARTWWRGLCEKGSLWLKADAKDPNAPDYEPEEPKDELDPKPSVMEHAIMLDAPEGKSIMQSKKAAIIRTFGDADSKGSEGTGEETPDDLSACVLIQSQKSKIKIDAKENVYALCKNWFMNIRETFGMLSANVFWSVRNIFDIKGSISKNASNEKNRQPSFTFLVRPRSDDSDEAEAKPGLHLSYSSIKTLETDFVSSKQKNTGFPEGDLLSTIPLKPHSNHIFYLEEEDWIQDHADSQYTPDESTYPYQEFKDALDFLKNTKTEDLFVQEEPSWRYPNYKELIPGAEFFEPLSEQSIRMENLDKEDPENFVFRAIPPEYPDTTKDQYKLDGGERTINDSYPPTVKRKELSHQEGKALTKEAPPYKQMADESFNPLESIDFKRKFLKEEERESQIINIQK